MPIELRLLGMPAVQTNSSQPPQIIPNTKPALLMLYLAYTGEWIHRASLASMFQSFGSDSSVRRYLRVLLNRARAFPWAQTLEIESERLRLSVITDVQRFRAAIAAQQWSNRLCLARENVARGVRRSGSACAGSLVGTRA
ncbi:MAG: hypothetical protein HC933_20600 [Pleurocapsa sp. SU_196_0]|nr:hypothetical protein [Pleurocapsa sp. SU_196_0]